MMTLVRDSANRYLARIRESPTQIAASVLAFWLFLQGPIGLLVNSDFSMHPMGSRSIELFGFIPVTVNGWHAMFHLITGGLGLILVRTRTGAISYATIIAAIYIPVGMVGVVSGTSVCGMIAVDAFGSWVHVIEGATMVMAIIAALTPRTNASRRVPA
ncbi:DUF4383 domain-containing protein [Rhodococcus sp. G-MC3]|uniref:DUF4383 domain-containing protein n=1 Tax=Rhodococcus sp. G-MC3 TaxID=3046209 RepID=UPI0024BB755C|nr:DUF4383 domain-containing protein [Rhodococcus sp. G-MC3]MDJ0396752.1 DUF4383 domain-containing protein [Rhodococcus sp. G-MC3]